MLLDRCCSMHPSPISITNTFFRHATGYGFFFRKILNFSHFGYFKAILGHFDPLKDPKKVVWFFITLGEKFGVIGRHKCFWGCMEALMLLCCMEA